MSEPKLISPLLDGFVIGSPMSSRNGVCCCPAMQENSDKKYIVKIISVPASQVQLDALLLTKAYKDPADALEYFKSQADEITEEAEFLNKLAKLEGFLSYEGWQIVPMKQSELGYDVYLLSTYRRSLTKYMRRKRITHLEAVNLGLDLCAALSVCRRSGRICTDLKPGNIFVSQEKEFRIGDLGFVPLNALRYMNVPDRSVSPYLPPEARDLLGTLNDTADTYALGMILYQIYNGGTLPDPPEDPEKPFEKPMYADDDMARILLKACAPKPEDRWKDPIEMGQALVGYMQRCTVNDTPIAPEPPQTPVEEEIPAKPPSQDVSGQEDASTTTTEETTDFSLTPLPEQKDDHRSAETWEIIPENGADEASVQDAAPPPDSESEDLSDIAAPAEAATSEEPVIPPTLPDSPPPESAPQEPEPDSEDDFSRELDAVNQLLGTPDFPKSALPETVKPAPVKTPPKPEKVPKEKRSGGRGVLITLLLLFLLAAIAFGGYAFYRYYYLLPIDSMAVAGSQKHITVTVQSSADLSALEVTCTDIYGKVMRSALENGEAVFEDLSPDSLYKIQLETSGLHKLSGETSQIFTTDPITEIVDVTAITGSEDGSLVLSLTVKGKDPEEWVVACYTDGEETTYQNFTGHSVTVKGLTIGKTYSFAFSASDDTQLAGNLTADFIASAVIAAKDLTVTAHTGTTLSVHWESPVDPSPAWTVRCYGSGYDEYQEVTGTDATFTGIDASSAYTIEVTAEGMTHSERLNVTANPVNITEFQVTEDTDTGSLQVQWTYDGAVPQSGWTLTYSIDGTEVSEPIQCETSSAEISPIIPEATYSFTVTSPDEISVFNNTETYTSAKAKVFSGHALTGYRISARTLATPEEDGWTQSSVSSKAYTSSFTLGQSISLVLQASVNFYLHQEDVQIMYVIRDGEGHVMPEFLGQETRNWHDLWGNGDFHFCELNLPHVPDTAGSYTVEIYFDGQSAAKASFTVESSL